MAKLPWFKFFPDDWLSDENLRICSVAARGLWMDMLSLMHKNGRRGYLQQASGKPVTAEQLSRMTGLSTDDVSRLLSELIDSGVALATDDGVIFSKRMVRDDQIFAARQQAGRKGGKAKAENLLKQNSSKPPSKTPSKTLANGLAPSGVCNSSDFLISSEEENPETAGVGCGEGVPCTEWELTPGGIATAWCFYSARMRYGRCADQAEDVATEIAEMIRHGAQPAAVLAEVLRTDRDRGEHFWQFKRRMSTVPGGKKWHEKTFEEKLAEARERNKPLQANGSGKNGHGRHPESSNGS